LDAFFYFAFDRPLIVLEGVFESFKLPFLALKLVDILLESSDGYVLALFGLFKLRSHFFGLLFSLSAVVFNVFELKLLPFDFLLLFFNDFPEFFDLSVLIN
jgi:hypothetical protein